jgi:membrane peptidoglycan carboxypeptidase
VFVRFVSRPVRQPSTVRIYYRLALVVIASGVVLALAVGAMAVPARLLDDAGSGEPGAISLRPLAQRSYMYASDGSVLAVLREEENRQSVPLDTIPQHVISAILAVEDVGFWVHEGFDVRGMLRAFRANVEEGGISQGGSTITQQLVKLDVLGNEQTLDRKIEEIVLASRLEKMMTKEEILDRYINTVYFGNHAYGIQAAAETYFGVNARDLTPGQAALLAGLIRNPVSYNPIRFPERAAQRIDIALERMVAVGALTKADAVAWKEATPVPTAVHDVLPRANDYFASAVEQQLLADERLGKTPEERRNAVYFGGLKVFTTYSPVAQVQAQVARDQNLPLVNGVFPAGTDPATGKPRFGSAAVVSVGPKNGAIPYMVAGPGFKNYKYNLVTQNKRQTGSSFKTFVLATAMERGYSPEDQVDGTGPCLFANPLGEPDPYPAENFGGSTRGVGTITTQTLGSVNCAYIRLGLIVGLNNVVNMAQRLGLHSTAADGLAANQSLPLGSAGVTPLDMASAYATLANDGVYNPPYMIERVEDRNGKVIFQHQPAPKRVISQQTARLVTEILRQNVTSGTGTAAALGTGQPAAGKTGTHTGSYDAWFVGYTPQLATAVWIGGLGAQFTIRLGGAGITGGSYPARIWGDFMRAWHANRPIQQFASPAPVRGGRMLAVPGGIDLSRKPEGQQPPPGQPPGPPFGPPDRRPGR